MLELEEQEQRNSKRLQEELANLRGLIGEGKLREVVAKGEALLANFPRNTRSRTWARN